MRIAVSIIAFCCVSALLLGVKPPAAFAATVTVNIQGGQAVTFVGAVHRWDKDGNLLRKVNPKAKIDAPEVDHTATKTPQPTVARKTPPPAGSSRTCRRASTIW